MVKKTLKNTWPEVLLGCLLVFHLTSNILWSNLNQTPPPWDPANHIIISAQLKDCFSSFLDTGLIRCLTVSPFYPPLVHSLVSLAFLLFGTKLAVAQLASNIFFALMVGAVYIWAKEFYKSKSIALLTASVTSFLPVLFDAGRFLWLEIPLVAIIYFAMYLLLKSNSFSDKKFTVAAFVALGLGIMSKWYVAVSLFIPFALTFLQSLKKNQYKKTLATVSVGIFISALISAPWFIANKTGFLYYASFYTKPDFSEPSVLFSLENITWYLKMFASYQIGMWFFAIFLGILGYYLANKNIKNKGFSLSFLLFGYIVFTALGNKDFRYTYYLLPVIASIIAISVTEMHKKYRTVSEILSYTILATLLIQYFTLSYRNYLEIEYKKSIRLPIFEWAPIINLSDYPVQSFGTDYWPNDKIVGDIMELANGKKVKLQVIVEYPQINATNLKMELLFKEAKNVAINEDFPFETAESLKTRANIVSFLKEKDYILVPENEASPDYYIFEDLLDRVQNVMLSENNDFSEVVKIYELPTEAVYKTLLNARLPQQEDGERYEYCESNSCNRVFLYRVNHFQE